MPSDDSEYPTNDSLRPRNFMTPWGWLLIAIAAYLLLLLVAYRFYQNQQGGAQTVNPDDLVIVDLVDETPSTTPANSLTGQSSPTTTDSYTFPTDKFEETPYPVVYLSDGNTITTDNGWVTYQGAGLENKPINETYYMIAESEDLGLPLLWLQQEVKPIEGGFWRADVRYGTPDELYKTYIIATNNDFRKSWIWNASPFRQLPEEFRLVTKPVSNLIKQAQ